MLGPSSNHLTVEYVGLALTPGSVPAYAWTLKGASGAMPPPGTERRVLFANLAPGRYRFEVRAVDGSGALSAEPATVSIQVLPPVWRRAWFLALAALAVGGAAVSLHRARLRRALALERIRRRIAVDLHDDLGAGLSEIAILSEVARRNAGPDTAPLLGQSADLARGMRESMSDIVWSIDPGKDHASDLVRRMRQIVHHLFEAGGVRVELELPQAVLDRTRLGPEERRQVLLIFKEAVTNAARHAGADRIRITLDVEGPDLRLIVEDDGCGFEGTGSGDGNGLASMTGRAAELGGELALRTVPGSGTRIEARLPVRSRRRARWTSSPFPRMNGWLRAGRVSGHPRRGRIES